MRFQFPASLSLLLLPLLSGISSASFIKHRRYAVPDGPFSLYAYGEGIHGLPVFYGDGIAYIGSTPPSSVSSTMMNLTLSPASSDTSAWVPTGDTSMKMYINTTSGAFDPVGFTSSTPSSGDDDYVTTSGFGFYGRTVVNFDGGNVLAQFWATEVSGDSGTHVLGWNQNGAEVEGSVPVIVRNVAPVTVKRS